MTLITLDKGGPRSRPQPGIDHFLSHRDFSQMIQVEGENGCASRLGDSFDPSRPNRKMVVPDISTRIEQPPNRSRRGIDATDIRPFASIAPTTPQREILGLVVTAVLSGNYVIDLKLQKTK